MYISYGRRSKRKDGKKWWNYIDSINNYFCAILFYSPLNRLSCFTSIWIDYWHILVGQKEMDKMVMVAKRKDSKKMRLKRNGILKLFNNKRK